MTNIGEPETTSRIVGPVAGPLMERTYVTGVLDVAARIGALMLASQAGTADVAQTMSTILSAYGVDSSQSDVTSTTIILSVPHDVEDAPLTLMWHVQARSLDYTRLSQTIELAQQLADDRPDPSWAIGEIERIEQAPHPYPRWVSTIALGVMGGAFSLLLGANAPVAMIAVATTALIDVVARILNNIGLPMLFRQVVAGLIAAGVTIAVDGLGWLPKGSTPSLIIAANVMALLSGMALVSSVQDAIGGYHLTATGRFMEILLSTVGIFIGIGAAIRIGIALHVDVHVSTNISATWLSLPVRVFAGLLGAAAAAVAGYAQRRTVIAAGVAGGLGALVYFSMRNAGMGNVFSAFVAAITIGLLGVLIAERLRIPSLIVAMSGIRPLVPGFALYRGFVNLVDGNSAAGVALMMIAAGIALALAGGVVLGPLLIPPRFRRYRVVQPAHGSDSLRVQVPVLAGIKAHHRRRGHQSRPC